MKLTIIGASGHGKVAADVAKLNGYDEIVFLDDDETLQSCNGYPVVGKADSPADGDIFVAIGNGRIRERLSADRKPITLVHPDAVIADGVRIGAGTIIMAGTVINSGTTIGQGCIINTASSIDHDCSVGDFVHVAVGAHLCGNVYAGRLTWIGAGSIVSNNVNICGSCMIGAGAVVIKDIEEVGTYVGVPAKKVIEHSGEKMTGSLMEVDCEKRENDVKK